MVKAVISNSEGLVQTRGDGVVFQDGITAPNHTSLTLGDTSQAVGTITARIRSNVNTGPIIGTGITEQATNNGATILTNTMLSQGYVTVTSDGADTAVTMPTKAHIIELFGGADNITVGDYIEWTLYNDFNSTTLTNTLKLTANTGQTVQLNQCVLVRSQWQGDQSLNTVAGNANGRFRTQVTNVDGSTATFRIS